MSISRTAPIALLGCILLAGLPACQDRAISLAMDGGVKYDDVTLGQGTAAQEGMLVGVSYTVALPDGTVIIDTFEQKRVHRFVIGDGTVIPGLDIGIRGMQRGGVRKLSVPPRSHYGKHGYADIIPPNTTLQFTVHLVELQPSGPRPETMAERRMRQLRR
ncbi:MAG: FKBP-type peptidyl-prolyl cis-trans isomerase [Phycisphaeraceae bacterium]|nr:MAG: FKBP-type peptidyl-prolyl cis-trans isomerase [Phycisphaeraceae bacterium]